MHQSFCKNRLGCLMAAFTVVAAPVAALGGEGVGLSAPTLNPTEQSDPCSFFRSQAYGRGLSHYATEMLWACEAIASRRAAEMTLSERMIAVDLALERYRTAVIEAGAAAFARDRAREQETGYFGAGDQAKAQLAESTGMMAALEAIQFGF